MERELATSPLFDGVAGPAIRAVAGFSRRAIYRPGEALVHEGDRNNRDVFLLLAGEVEVILSSMDYQYEPRDLSLAAGDFPVFGEVACLLGVPRTATVRAVGEVVAIRVNGEQLLEYMEDDTAAGYRILHNVLVFMAKRLQGVNRLLKNAIF